MMFCDDCGGIMQRLPAGDTLAWGEIAAVAFRCMTERCHTIVLWKADLLKEPADA